MNRFIEGNLYSRKQVWSYFRLDTPYPNGGPWATVYVVEGKNLIAFSNINSPGRTGHDFPNSFDEISNTMIWFGKPNAHSEQPTFRSLFKGDLNLLMFARWDNKSTLFSYLGQPSITKFVNDISVSQSVRTIKLELKFNSKFTQDVEETYVNYGEEGSKQTKIATSYERNPRLRAECIRIHGCTCAICGFDFEKEYGVLGQNFCHVHHIIPLSEVGENHKVSPQDDLIPVCPNCHAMLHKTKPALQPKELRQILVNKH